jgi:2-C-methyl-D-erythritol 4-phosphate cytidylyltransferase/2-C-methyl-D-erythritol 2,4-cyclodiphosphate synthase
MAGPVTSLAIPVPDTAALVVAAGHGVRAGEGEPKQYRRLGDRPVLAHAVGCLARHPAIGRVHVVVAPGDEARACDALGALGATIGAGGATRQESVRLGLAQLAAAGAPRRVLVHDAARPFVPAAMVGRVLAALADATGACPALPVVDSLRRGNNHIEAEVPRDRLWRAQTPQGFDFAALVAAHAAAPPGATDDAEVLRAAGHAVAIVAGDERAMKLTFGGDFAAAERLLNWETLTGAGYDVHRLGPGDHVWLLGVRIPHEAGLIGHSDADVGLHALTDAILGAIAAGDIGVHFPPSDPQWKGAASHRFLAHAADLVTQAGGRILHCDVTLVAEAPRVGPHRPAMLARLAEILTAHAPRLSVKATTTEGLGFTGRREGIAAHAVATVRLPLGLQP